MHDTVRLRVSEEDERQLCRSDNIISYNRFWGRHIGHTSRVLYAHDFVRYCVCDEEILRARKMYKVTGKKGKETFCP